MVVYLTFNDAPSGIYYSQVTDVCAFLRKNPGTDVRLIAFISLRHFFQNRAKIKLKDKKAIVAPMMPTLFLWKCNIVLLSFLFFVLSPEKVFARGPFAASLSIMARKLRLIKKVIYDARGAVYAEFEEYGITTSKRILSIVRKVESRAVRQSDQRLSVSTPLIEYWNKTYHYQDEKHVVIPCTYNSTSFQDIFSDEERSIKRSSLGYLPDDIVLVFSGSSSGWQSFQMADEFLFSLMSADQRVKVLVLTNKDISDLRVSNLFKNRFKTDWLPEDKVKDVLSCCDYGLLLREPSLTNRVASPVKFAEYLAAGLKVIISEGIGDCSGFIKEHHCGWVLGKEVEGYLSPLTVEERKKNRTLAEQYYSKESQLKRYRQLIA